MSYSIDFRKQLFKIKDNEDLTFEQASERFGVPIRTLFRWKNCIYPKTKRNKPSTKVDIEALRKDVEQNPNHYQYERAKKLDVAQSTIFYALKRLGKKNAIPFQQINSPDLSFQLQLFRYEFIEKHPIIIWMKVALQ